MLNLFVIWNWLCLLAFVLLIFRGDAKGFFTIGFLKRVFRGFWLSLLTAIILYFYIPFTIPNSLIDIFKQK